MGGPESGKFQVVVVDQIAAIDILFPIKHAAFMLKALTDHFGEGSRVVSFDPYS